MIRYEVTKEQEHKLRREYVNSDDYDPNKWMGYRDYAVTNVPGLLEAAYLGGDNSDYIEVLMFDQEKHLTWFVLVYS
jgi:hypothetical protein